MKSFKGFLKEETMPFANVRSGGMDIEDSAVRDNINSLLAGMTNGKFVTPYIALERVAKTLANFHIFLPAQTFLEGDSGTAIVPINQYGLKMGQNDNGEVVTVPAAKYTVFFEYRMSDCGMFEIFCEVVDEDELDEILTDLEAELNGDTEEEEDLDEMVDLSKVTLNKNTGNISSKDNKVDLSKVALNKNTGKLSSLKEEDLPEEAKLFAPEMGTKRTPGSNQVPMTTGVTIPDGLEGKSREKMKSKLEKKSLDEESNDDKHFEKQSKKMQTAINLHLRKGKSYAEAVKSAKVHVKEETINEITDKLKNRYVKKAESDKKSAERQADFSDREAKDSGNSPERKKAFGKESEWLKGIATKRAKGIAMATKKMQKE